MLPNSLLEGRQVEERLETAGPRVRLPEAPEAVARLPLGLARGGRDGYSRLMDGPAESFLFRPVGYIRTPYLEAAGTPIQGAACETEGRVELLPGFEAGLEGIEGFSHLILLYVFDRCAAEVPLRQKPYLGNEERGVFAIRSPLRPNPIGLTVVRLLAREGAALRVRGVDMLDGTPLLDIKPFVARVDGPTKTTSGWLEPHLDKVKDARADGRFSGGRRK